MTPRLLEAAIGAWLMAAPAVLGYGGSAASNHQIVGPVAVSMAIIAIWETTRGLRWVNALLGVWLLIGILVVGGTTVAITNSVVSGVLLAGLPWLGGRTDGSYGGGWRALTRRTSRTAEAVEEE